MRVADLIGERVTVTRGLLPSLSQYWGCSVPYGDAGRCIWFLWKLTQEGGAVGTSAEHFYFAVSLGALLPSEKFTGEVKKRQVKAQQINEITIK